MNSTINTSYTDAPTDVEQALEAVIMLDDFLPSPAKLVREIEKEKVTITIDKRSPGLLFFAPSLEC